MSRLPTEYIKTRKEYILFKNDCGVTDMTRRGAIYEEYVFDYIRNNIDIKGKTIIDIGANFGFHTLEFADLVEDGQVVSFEPQKLVYYQLCGHIILNGYDNITAHNIALSNKHTTLKMENMPYHSTETINIGNSHLNAYCESRYNFVEVRTLDSYEFENVAVIKIDVQGCETEVLDGAIKTIKKHKPIIFIEVADSELQIYNYTEQDVFNRLDALGYTYKKIIEADHLLDYVAIPK